jgi:hypothetical protein
VLIKHQPTEMKIELRGRRMRKENDNLVVLAFCSMRIIFRPPYA